MIKTNTSPLNQFMPSFAEDNDHNTEIHSILVYIGLLTVALLCLLLIISIIGKCMRMLDDDVISTTEKIKRQQKQMGYQRYPSAFSANRQTNISLVSSSPILINYKTKSRPSKSSLSQTLRILQSKQYDKPPMVHV